MPKYSITIFTLIILIHFSESYETFGQKLINESFHNEPMPTVLDVISKKYQLKFSYDYTLLKKVKVSGNYRNLDEKDFIKKLISKYKFGFEKIDGVYLINPQIKSKEDKIIKGVIIDKNSKERLPYANIYDKKTHYVTASNQDGYFTLFANSYDTVSLAISYLGYKTKEITLLPDEAFDNIHVSLENQDKLIPKVDVKTLNIKTVELNGTAGHLTVNPTKMADLPVLGELDIFRNLQLFPGISSTDNSSSGLVIRNSPPDQTLVTFDGFTILDLDHFFGMFSAINSKVVKDIQVYKGGFEAKYGNRVSSVVEITGKSGDLSKPAVHFNLNMISANLVVQVPVLKKASILFAARRSYNDIVKTPLYDNLFNKIKSPIDDSYWLVNGAVRHLPYALEPTFSFYDINLKLNFPLSEKDVLQMSYYKGEDNLDLLDSTQTTYFQYQIQEKMNWGNSGVGMKWSRNWSKTVTTTLSASYSNYFNNYSDEYSFLDFGFSDTTSSHESNNISNFNLKLNTVWHINKKNKLEFGIDNNSTSINFMSSWGIYDVQDINQYANQLSLFAQNTWSFNPELKLITGLRANFISSGEQSKLEPRVSLLYNFVPSLTFKASAGKYHQYLNKVPVKNFDGINRDYWIISDNVLAPAIESNHYTVGLNFKNDGLIVDFEAYYKDASNLVEYESPFLNEFSYQTTGLEGFYHKGIGKIAGIDILILKEYRKYNGWIGYSYGKSIRKFPGINDGLAYPSNNDQRHELKIVNMLKLKKWNLALTWTYGSGKPYTKPEGQYYIKLLDGQQRLISVPSRKNSSRLPSFHSLDMSVSYNFRLASGFGKVGISVFNLYGRENIKYRFYRIADDTDFYSSQNPVYNVYDIKLLGFTPNVFISFDF